MKAEIPVSERGAVDAAFVRERTPVEVFLDGDARVFVAGALQGALRLATENKWVQRQFVRIERSTT
jgi:hypothetical protein